MAKDFYVSGKLRMAGGILRLQVEQKIRILTPDEAVPAQETANLARNFTRPLAF